MTTKSLRRRINTARSKLNQIKARGAAQALTIQVEQLRGEIASADAALNEKTLRVASCNPKLSPYLSWSKREIGRCLKHLLMAS